MQSTKQLIKEENKLFTLTDTLDDKSKVNRIILVIMTLAPFAEIYRNYTSEQNFLVMGIYALMIGVLMVGASFFERSPEKIVKRVTGLVVFLFAIAFVLSQQPISVVGFEFKIFMAIGLGKMYFNALNLEDIKTDIRQTKELIKNIKNLKAIKKSKEMMNTKSPKVVNLGF